MKTGFSFYRTTNTETKQSDNNNNQPTTEQQDWYAPSNLNTTTSFSWRENKLFLELKQLHQQHIDHLTWKTFNLIQRERGV